MTTHTKLNQILTVLIAAGIDDLIYAEHDIIYLAAGHLDPNVEAQLEELGAFYNTEDDGWAIYT